ncbi:MAG: DNA-binding response regulator [Gemmatales bacterium]|nr:MAG: DNA-binding response regulator [Gemmatales bacterium]
MKRIRVLLVDDHKLIREGLRAVLGSAKGIDIVGEASDGREALQQIAEHKPDVVLMDVAMPSMNGLQATEHIVREFPGVRVLMLSMHANEEYICQALRAGAAGYMLKQCSSNELQSAIGQVAQGATCVVPSISQKRLVQYLQRTSENRDVADLLTLRQREILQLLAEGETTRAIASKLQISVKTVEAHRAQIMDRLNIFDLPGLVRYAIRVGLVTPH